MALRTNTALAIFASGISAISALIAIPLLKSSMSDSSFGILIFCLTIGNVSLILDLGLGASLTTYLARASTDRQVTSIGPLIVISLLFAASTGLIAGCLLYASRSYLTHLISPQGFALHENTANSIAYTSASLPFISATSTARGILEGTNRYHFSAINKAVSGSLSYLFPLLGVFADHGPNSIQTSVIFLSTSRLIVFASALFPLTRLMLIRTPLKLHEAFHRLRALLERSAWIFFSGVIGPIMVFGDRFVISAILGVESLPFYFIPQELISKSAIVTSALSSALLPALSSVNGTIEGDRVYLKTKSLNKYASLLFALCLAVVIKPIMSLWVSPSFAAKASIICYAIIIGTCFNSISMVYVIRLYSMERTRAVFIIHAFQLAIFLPIMIAMIKVYGLNGAALAWCLRCAVDALCMRFMSAKITSSAVQTA